MKHMLEIPKWLRYKNLDKMKAYLEEHNIRDYDEINTIAKWDPDNNGLPFTTWCFNSVNFDAALVLYALKNKHVSLAAASDEIFRNLTIKDCFFNNCFIGAIVWKGGWDTKHSRYISCFLLPFAPEFPNGNTYINCSMNIVDDNDIIPSTRHITEEKNTYCYCYERSTKLNKFQKWLYCRRYFKYLDAFDRIDALLWKENGNGKSFHY